jgi:hypothetical protein
MSPAVRNLGDNSNDASPISQSSLTPAGSGRLSRRVLITGALAGGMILAALALLLEMFVAQRIPALTAERLVEAQERWRRNGPTSYDMDLEILGERPGPVHVEVRLGQVTAMTRDGRTPDPRTWHYWTVLGQFETLERELVMAEDPTHEAQASAGTQWRLRCEFDPRYGFPSRFQRTVFGGGPDVYWRVTQFVVR